MTQLVRRMIEPNFFSQNAWEEEKAWRYAVAMLGGARFPPAIVARYGDKVMPIDGHHRLRACQLASRECDVWEIDGDAFEDLSLRHPNPDRMLIKMIDQCPQTHRDGASAQ